MRIRQEARESKKLAETLFNSVFGEAASDASSSGLHTLGPEHPGSPRLPGRDMPSLDGLASASDPGKRDRALDRAVIRPVPDDRRNTRTVAATTTTANTHTTTTTTTTTTTRAATVPATTSRASAVREASPVSLRASAGASAPKEKERAQNDAKTELRSAWTVPPSPGKKIFLGRLRFDSPNTGHTAFWAAMHDGLLRLQDLPGEPGLRESLSDAMLAYAEAAQGDPASFGKEKTTPHKVAFIKAAIGAKQTVFAAPLMHRFQTASFLDVLESAVNDRSFEGLILLTNWLEKKKGTIANEEKVRLLEGIKKVEHSLPIFGTSLGIPSALAMMAELLANPAES